MSSAMSIHSFDTSHKQTGVCMRWTCFQVQPSVSDTGTLPQGSEDSDVRGSQRTVSSKTFDNPSTKTSHSKKKHAVTDSSGNARQEYYRGEDIQLSASQELSLRLQPLIHVRYGGGVLINLMGSVEVQWSEGFHKHRVMFIFGASNKGVPFLQYYASLEGKVKGQKPVWAGKSTITQRIKDLGIPRPKTLFANCWVARRALKQWMSLELSEYLSMDPAITPVWRDWPEAVQRKVQDLFDHLLDRMGNR